MSNECICRIPGIRSLITGFATATLIILTVPVQATAIYEFSSMPITERNRASLNLVLWPTRELIQQGDRIGVRIELDKPLVDNMAFTNIEFFDGFSLLIWIGNDVMTNLTAEGVRVEVSTNAQSDIDRYAVITRDEDAQLGEVFGILLVNDSFATGQVTVVNSSSNGSVTSVRAERVSIFGRSWRTTITPDPTDPSSAISEPGSWVLLCVAFALLAAVGRNSSKGSPTTALM